VTLINITGTLSKENSIIIRFRQLRSDYRRIRITKKYPGVGAPGFTVHNEDSSTYTRKKNFPYSGILTS
jgi:hypothetical protein